jgi:hypothetical protein
MKRILAVAVVAACSKTPAPEAAPPEPVKTMAATQADLAKDVEQAMQVGTWTELRRKWTGTKLTWTVTRHAALCNSAARCNVAAFPVERPAKQGWLPALAFAPGQYDKLASACGTADCDFTFEGTVSEVRGSDAEPAAIAFKDVVFVKKS